MDRLPSSLFLQNIHVYPTTIAFNYVQTSPTTRYITRIQFFPEGGGENERELSELGRSQVGFDPLINSAAGVFGLLMEEVLTPSVSKIWNEFPVQMNSRQPFRGFREGEGNSGKIKKNRWNGISLERRERERERKSINRQRIMFPGVEKIRRKEVEWG